MHGGRAMLAMEHAPVAHHCRNSVLENQLLLTVVFEEHGILIEGPDLAGKLDAADQVNRNGGFVLANGIQEGVLNVLCRLIFHFADLLLSSSVGCFSKVKTWIETNKTARTPT
jgi:hypothetical protein